MFKRYRWNFVYVVILVSVLSFLIFDVILFYSIKNYLFRQTMDEMKMKTNLAVRLLDHENLSSLSENSKLLIDLTAQLKQIVNSRVTIIDSQGKVLTDSDVADGKVSQMDNHINRPEVQEALNKGWGQVYRKSDTVNRNLFYTAFPFKHGNEVIGFLRLAYYAHGFEESMNQILRLIFIANMIGLIILVLAALYLGSVVTYPILRIVNIAEKISQGDLESTFSVRRKDEVGTLAMILNQLTERLKNQIRQVSSERSKLQDILMNLDIGILVLNQDKQILNANPEISRILEIEDEKIINENILKILDSEALLKAIDNTLKTGFKERGEFTCPRNGRKIFLSYVLNPLYISEENTTGVLIQIHNITELKTLEAIRKDFVANASHELKTPLTSIIGYAETLVDGAAEEPFARMKFMRKIREQAQRLEFLVADLLHLSQIESDEPLELSALPLIHLIKEVVDEFEEKAVQKNITIALEAHDEIRVKMDKEGMRVVFNNLLDNAVKYTSEGGSIKIQVHDAAKNRVKIEVSDTGIGIDQKYHDRIFQRFYRVDKARSRSLGGTGLGLSIVKHIIEKHGSRISVISELGKGSCFCFELEKI
ncbi:MAG: cell wall metabolism sensor histidine kinase WalK [bacterium]|jgi:two-component system phosphate regulon sensor histidine kinase PhoR|nr:cell wall metabolism sensor histidine kinase WalK [bacterium]